MEKESTETTEMKVNIAKINPCKLSLDFEIPAEMVASETEKMYLEIQQNAKPAGFRQGKAPIGLIKQKYASTAKEKVVENIIRNSVFPTLKEKNITPVDSPAIEKVEFEPDKPLKFRVILEQHPEIKAKNYRELKLKKQIKKVTEKNINEAVADVQKYNTRLAESKSDTVKKSDSVVANYEVWSDGKEMTELRGENQLIDLNSEHILPGLAEGLVGTKKNEQKEISSKLPENHPKQDYAGKEITLKVKIQAIKEKILPKLDDEFAKDLGYTNFSELKNKVKESLETNNLREANEKIEENITEHLLKSNPIPALPESLVRTQTDHLVSSFEQRCMYQGISKEAIEKQKESAANKFQEEAKKQVKLMYIFASITEQENITVTEKELRQKRDELVKSSPQREKLIDSKENMNRLISRLKTDKIFGYILDNSKIKTTYV
jgi:trigger factor